MVVEHLIVFDHFHHYMFYHFVYDIRYICYLFLQSI